MNTAPINEFNVFLIKTTAATTKSKKERGGKERRKGSERAKSPSEPISGVRIQSLASLGGGGTRRGELGAWLSLHRGSEGSLWPPCAGRPAGGERGRSQPNEEIWGSHRMEILGD